MPEDSAIKGKVYNHTFKKNLYNCPEISRHFGKNLMPEIWLQPEV